MHTAFILGSLSIRYSGLLIFLAALCAVCTLLALRSASGRPLAPALYLCTLTVILALPLSRVQEAFERLDKYVFNP